jgi:hypothetical protein
VSIAEKFFKKQEEMRNEVRLAANSKFNPRIMRGSPSPSNSRSISRNRQAH